MGNDLSLIPEWIDDYLHATQLIRRDQWVQDQKLFKDLDTRTKVPHLLIELRSLGYVEICGKDLGGIHSRLEEWLQQKWGCKLVTREARESKNQGGSQACHYAPCISDHMFGCILCGMDQMLCPFRSYLTCGVHPCWPSKGATVSLMEDQELLEGDRLCDRNFVVPTSPTPGCCQTVAEMELDRHYPVCCWCGARYFCSTCVPKPSVFRRRGFHGENNMGKLTMEVVDFMTNECGWSLKLCNGTNLGFYGDIREQQLKFKAPHPLNIIAPHIMIELRAAGYVEVNGANTHGIHEKIENWLVQTWKATRISNDPNFCDIKFRCKAFSSRGWEGENNMGLLTMQMVDFMVKSCAWTMIACNGGNFGMRGDIREQQLVFRHDAHLQHSEDHIMVELRDVEGAFSSSGYVEVNGISSSPDVASPLDEFLKTTWGCKDFSFLRQPFCEKKYRTPPELFYREKKLTNNMGKRTIELAMFMASQGWLLLLCNGGAISEMKHLGNRIKTRIPTMKVGEEFSGLVKREQQVKFVKAHDGDSAGAPLLMIELRAVPQDPEVESIGYCYCRDSTCTVCCHDKNRVLTRTGDYDYNTQAIDRQFTRRAEVDKWIRSDAWSKMPSVKKGNMDITTMMYPKYQEPAWRERGKSERFACPVYEGLIEVNGPDTANIYAHLNDFIVTQMRGELMGSTAYCDRLWSCGVFRLKRVSFPHTIPEYDGYYLGENNFGAYTMRLCDFLVDHLGEWDLVSCNGNCLERAWKVDRDRGVSMVVREQQLIFRYRGDRKNVFLASEPQAAPLGRPPLDPLSYWKEPSKAGTVVRDLIPIPEDELAWLQQMLDGTYKSVASWDRRGGALADRFVAVAGMRSEHPLLWDRYAKRRESIFKLKRTASEFVTPKTMAASAGLAQRCEHPTLGNPTNEAYLLHGTSPTSALGILGTSFKIDLAGKSAGTMFGPGVYLAEASSKADEYASDNTEGIYKGLFAMLICRVILGRPFITEKAGNYAQKCTSGEYDVVVGDREKVVGTYREFVIFDEGSIYPEYVIFYRRENASPCAVGPAILGAPKQHTMQEVVSI